MAIPPDKKLISYREAYTLLKLSKSGFSHLTRRYPALFQPVKRTYLKGKKLICLFYDENQIKSFHARKMRIPLLEDQPYHIIRQCADLRTARAILNISLAHLKVLITKRKISCFCNVHGQLFVYKPSLQQYLHQKKIHYAKRYTPRCKRKNGSELL